MATTGIKDCEDLLQEVLRGKEKGGRLLEMAFKMQ